MPPKGFRLAWTLVGPKNTRNGPRTLWSAAPSTLINTAYSASCSSRLYKLGFSKGWDGAIVFWEPPEYDPAAAAAEILAITLEIRAYRNRTRNPRREAARLEAERRAEMDKRRGKARENLQRIMSQRYWAIHPNFVERARHLSGLHELDDGLAIEAEKIVRSTDRTVERAESRLNNPAGEDLRAFCTDPRIIDAVSEALRAITRNDEDWATKKNDIGWSKTTTVDGHVLALQEKLTPDLAAHAMRLLKIHHTQVPAEVRPILGMKV